MVPHWPTALRQPSASMKFRLALSLLLLLAACSKLSVENYDKLKVGMPYAEVTQLLGAPAQCDDVLGVKHCRWGDEKRHIDVNFIGGQALLFSAENIH
jgi:hypothetical protein